MSQDLWSLNKPGLLVVFAEREVQTLALITSTDGIRYV
jgi:hypothetical protein